MVRLLVDMAVSTQQPLDQMDAPVAGRRPWGGALVRGGRSEGARFGLDALGHCQRLCRFHPRPGFRHDACPQRHQWTKRGAGALP